MSLRCARVVCLEKEAVKKRRRKNFIAKRDKCHGMDTDVEAPRRLGI